MSFLSVFYRGGVRDPARENPDPTAVLGVFGLSTQTDERTLQDVFGKFGKVKEVVLISDRMVKRQLQYLAWTVVAYVSCAYSFVTFRCCGCFRRNKAKGSVSSILKV